MRVIICLTNLYPAIMLVFFSRFSKAVFLDKISTKSEQENEREGMGDTATE